MTLMVWMVWAFLFTFAQLCSESRQALAWLWARRPRLWVWHWGLGREGLGSWTVTHQPPRLSRIPKAHRATYVSPGGAWTLFIGWRSERRWGFVQPDGQVISWRVRAAQRGMPNSAFSGGQNAAKG